MEKKMTNKEVYGFGKVIVGTIKNSKSNKITTNFRLRGMIRKMCDSGIITKTQRNWLSGQIIKAFETCESNHYILGKRVYK